jgi:hypothetical protein
MDQRTQFRCQVLQECGAGLPQVEELLAYNTNLFDRTALAKIKFPLPDEPFVETWEKFAQEVTEAGTFLVLAKYLVQLRFPVQAGISRTGVYIDATTKGAGFGADNAPGVKLEAPDKCCIAVHATPAGRIPLIIAEARGDFETLVRALARRNEPVSIPPSMGACMVSGYNNWDRIYELVRVNGAADFSVPSTYQDRFIILSRGPYSGVAGADLGLAAAEWGRLSFLIRRAHECTHYFTRRVFSSMRNNLLDEIIADYCGIVSAAGRFRPDWMLRFFGLQDFPHYQTGARLENYKGKPEVSHESFVVLQQLVKRAVDNLARFDRPVPEAEGPYCGFPLQMLLALSGLTLEELASDKAADILLPAEECCPQWEDAAALARIMEGDDIAQHCAEFEGRKL